MASRPSALRKERSRWEACQCSCQMGTAKVLRFSAKNLLWKSSAHARKAVQLLAKRGESALYEGRQNPAQARSGTLVALHFRLGRRRFQPGNGRTRRSSPAPRGRRGSPRATLMCLVARMQAKDRDVAVGLRSLQNIEAKLETRRSTRDLIEQTQCMGPAVLTTPAVRSRQRPRWRARPLPWRQRTRFRGIP